MDLRVFNVSILVGWLLVLAGGITINVGAGLMVAGVLLIVIVLVISRLAGVFSAKPEGD